MKDCFVVVFVAAIVIINVSELLCFENFSLRRKLFPKGGYNTFQNRKPTRKLAFGIDCRSFPNLYKFVYSSAEADQCLKTQIDSPGENFISSSYSFNPFDDALFLFGILALSVLLKRMPSVKSGDGDDLEFLDNELKSEDTGDGLATCPNCNGTRIYQGRPCQVCEGTGFIARYGLPARRKSIDPWDLDD